MVRKSIALLLPTSSYRNDDFLSAAAALDVDVTRIANYCHQLAPDWGIPIAWSVPFDQPEVAFERLKAQFGARRFDAVLAVDDSGVELAAMLARHFGLRANPAAAIQALRDKLAFRRLQHAHGFAAPKFLHVAAGGAIDAARVASMFPVVVKARRLSASRGVIRADNRAQFDAALSRVAAIQNQADRDAPSMGIIVEAFIPGAEYAFEGMLENGRLAVLALFDKPDPLDGPYFEETLYVTPSRLAHSMQQRLFEQIQAHCAAAGLLHGPVHAEARIAGDRVVILEIAPRSIGGLCGRVLRYTLGVGLEELILRNALELDIAAPAPSCAAGVMMIPIPRRGILENVNGIERARQVGLIVDVVITAEIEQLLVPPPEGASYLGFIFARGDDPSAVEQALRMAHAALEFKIRPEYALSAQR